MKTTVAVGTYNIRKTENVEGHFSKMRQVLLDQGWLMRGEMKSHVNFERHLGELAIFVTLIQDFVKGE